MSRRRSVPWIHRWSRPLIAAIAILGAIATAYITVAKLTQSSTACVAGSCDLVLSSPYATVFGLPLALFGFLAYASMAAFALAPLAINPARQKEFRSQVESGTWLLLLVGSIAMTVFSGYLMYLLVFRIQATCIYCIASAIFSTTLLALTIIGRNWEDIGQILFTGIVVGMLTLIGTLGIYAGVNQPTTTTPGQTSASLSPTTPPTPGIGWQITTTSGDAEIALARHLTQIGAKEYVAWWCPHCHEQKQLFGQQAYAEINHTECAADGQNGRPDVCQAANVQSFPTWEIKGQLYPGVKSLEELAQLSGYQGPRNFQYSPT